MKKKTIATMVNSGLIAALMFFAVAMPVSAAVDDFVANGNITVEGVNMHNDPSTADMTIISGSTAESWTLSSGVFTVTNPGPFSVSSADADAEILVVFLAGAQVACGRNTTPGTSTVTVPTDSGTYTIKPSSSNNASCGGSSGTGDTGGSNGGGGGGGGTPATSGTATINANETKDFGQLPTAGKEMFMYVNSVASFSVAGSTGGHSLTMTGLDTATKVITFTLQSTPVTGSLSLGQSALYDLNGDGVKDVKVTFNALTVNKIDLTIEPAPKAATESAGVKLIAKENTQDAAVYSIGADGKKYVFPDSKTYFTWYENFDDVVRVSVTVLDSYPDGGAMTNRAGTKLVKTVNSNKTYAVEPGGVLRHIPSEAVAAALYGPNWALRVNDVIPGFFSSTYTLGEPLTDQYPSGTLVKSGTDIYYIENGTKRKVSTTVFTEKAFNNTFVINVSDLSKYTSGSDY